MIITTAFSYQNKTKPLCALVQHKGKKELLYLYAKGTNIKLSKVSANIKYLKDKILSGEEVIINDFKTHIEAFNFFVHF